jgi:hypothetical protein
VGGGGDFRAESGGAGGQGGEGMVLPDGLEFRAIEEPRGPSGYSTSAGRFAPGGGRVYPRLREPSK